MASQKITELTEDTAPTSDDLVVTVNSPAGTPASRKVSLANLRKAIVPGSTTQVLFNNAGTIDADSGLTYLSNSRLTVNGEVKGLSFLVNDGSGNAFNNNFTLNGGEMRINGADMAIRDTSINNSYFFRSGTGRFQAAANKGIWWTTTDDSAGISAVDTALMRPSAGLLEVDNGTLGTYRDLLARGLRSNAVAFSSAISSPVEGTIQAFTDSTTATWGATITGGGSNHVLGYFNGTNWTVMAK